MKKILNIVCIAVSVFIFLAAAAESADWFLLTTTNEVKMFVDKESITFPAFKLANAWRKYEFDPPMQHKDKKLTSLLVNSEENCDERKFRVLEEILIFTDGSEQKEPYSDPPWEAIVRGSLNQRLHDYVCE